MRFVILTIAKIWPLTALYADRTSIITPEGLLTSCIHYIFIHIKPNYLNGISILYFSGLMPPGTGLTRFI